MAKTTAPLLSFDARGQIAKTQVYASWRGRSYVRRHVIPANPNTADQQLTRNAFTWLQSVYKFMPSLASAPWEAYVTGKPLTARNAYTKFNLPDLRSAVDLTTLVGSPGVLGGIPAATLTVTGGVATVTVAATAPTDIPTGWTLDGLVAAVIADQDPQSGIDFTMQAAEDLTVAYSIPFTVVAGDYAGLGWLRWTRPDGRKAYSPSVTDIVTAT